MEKGVAQLGRAREEARVGVETGAEVLKRRAAQERRGGLRALWGMVVYEKAGAARAEGRWS
jgi:hypothetical protein